MICDECKGVGCNLCEDEAGEEITDTAQPDPAQ